MRVLISVCSLVLVVVGILAIVSNNPLQLPSHSDFAFRSRTGIPLILHMTWKTPYIPAHFQPYLATWINLNPHWKFAYWTDDSARALVASKYALNADELNHHSLIATNRYPQYLEQYDSYPKGIHRADFIRYCILETYGGVYADLDMENLRNMDDLLDKHAMIFGEEPHEHSYLVFNLKFLITNCLMMSAPQHPFWDLMFSHLQNTTKKKEICATTGPIVLRDAYVDYEFNFLELKKKFPIHIATPDVFFPGWDENNNLPMTKCSRGFYEKLKKYQREFCDIFKESNYNVSPRTNESYTVHHWIHTYYGSVEHDTEKPITELVPTHMFWSPTNSIQVQYTLPANAAIPKIIHQIWTNTSIPVRMDPYVRSWAHTYHSLGYKHKLWTSVECRGLIEKKYPYYLSMYDSYPSDLHRAHAAKYFIMDAHGGIVADLDVQAVGSMDALLSEFKLILGGEPLEHAHIIHDADFVLGNSIMASVAAHPFWKHVLSVLESSATESTVYKSVGPLVLNQAYLTLGHHFDMYIAQPQVFYPIHDVDHPTLREVCQEGKTPSGRQKSMCKVLSDHGYHQGEVSGKSMAACHWVFGFDDIANHYEEYERLVPSDMRAAF